jgi:hypothetical protein
MGDGSVLAEGVLDFDRQLAELTMHTGDVSTEVRLVDGTFYARAGNTWFAQKAEVDSSTPLDATRYLDYVRSLANDTHVAGDELVRGAHTTRYDATIDVRDVLASSEATAEQRDLSEEIFEQFGSRLRDMPISVWVDDDARVRRIRIRMDMSAIVSGSAEMTATTEFWDFGVEVRVDKPQGATSFG